MQEIYLLKTEGVKKKILHGGQGDLPKFPSGTKLVFHFQTLKCDFDRTVIDDSRKGKEPMEIIVGKMFKMEVWETLLTSMRIGEVAEFWCDSIHTGLYPIVSKGMRLIAEGKDPLEGQRHTCGMGNLFDYHSMGYKDLDELMREPQPLIFIMELIQVGDPFSYHRDSWAMDKDEKLAAVPALHSEGNALVKQRRFRAAARKYQEAVILLRNVQAKEKPGEEDYVKLDKLITPLVLNYCQCMLELKEYYEVLEHTTELIERKKGNVKAYYKRAKAHAAVWNEKEARQDFLMVATLDISLAPLVQREIKLLKERMREKYSEEKLSYWGILGDKGGHKNSDREEEEEEEEKEQELEEEEEKEVDKAKEELESTVTQREEVEQMVARDEKVKSRMEVPSKVGRPNQNTETDREQPQGSSGNGAAVPVGKGREEMLRLVPLLHNEGNYLMKETRYREASQKFKEAIDYVKFIQSKEDPREEDWASLEKVQLPLVLNYCQCMLELEEYYEVLEHTNQLLRNHKGNVKAFYKRAKAHAALCHDQEARQDFLMVCKLDPTFAPSIRKEMKQMGEMIRAKHSRAKRTYWTDVEEKWGKGRRQECETRRPKGEYQEEMGSEERKEMGINQMGQDRVSSTEETFKTSETKAEEEAAETNPAGDNGNSESTDVTQNIDLKASEVSNEDSGADGEPTAFKPTNESPGANTEGGNENPCP